MVEPRNSEINIEELMADIRAAVEQRESNGQQSLAGASLALHSFLASVNQSPTEQIELPPLELQPEFEPHADDHYHIDDLLPYHDHTFIWNAYLAILKREPDEVGLQQFLKSLRSGRYDKIDILASLRFSPEGESRNVTIEGLKRPSILRRLYRIPALGYIVEMLAAVVRLPAMIHRRRQFEEYALAQQELMRSHINQLSKATFQVTKPFPEEMADLSREQRRVAEIQHQQVVGLFHEQRKIINRLEKLRTETNQHLAQLSVNGNSDHKKIVLHDDDKTAKLDELLAAFIDEFRGPRAEVKKAVQRYLPVLEKAGISDHILDIGCGRGEWLEVLKDAGCQARGVENNSVLVQRLRALELEVADEDALSYLAQLPDETVNAVTAFHFVEHLTFELLLEFIEQTARVLRPAGVVILETPNPKNLVVGACNFYSDPTHNKPLFPESIRFMLEQRGFNDVRIEYVNQTGESPFSGREGSQELNSWFYSPRDFVVIGTRA